LFSNIFATDLIEFLVFFIFNSTLAHTKTEFLSPDKELIGHSIHIKYLPTGNIILDTLMKYYPPWLSPWLSELANRWVPPPQQSLLSLPKSDARDQSSEPYAIIQNHLQLSQTLGEAEFLATDRHTNPFGSVHGGCISVLFEIVSESYAKEQLAAIEIHLESIQIQFLSAARPKNKLQVSCETIKAVDNSYILVRVSLTKEKKESMGAAKETKTPLAQGTLKFLVAK
jgi:acyl-coenzyme A thioesterase PaaI-like protein